MTDYKILHAYTMWSIQKQVKKLMADWYKPQGWIFKSWGIYYQAMTKI